MVGTTTVTTRWDKCGGVPRGRVSAMLPRLELLFSRCPPSARSPQIRPHPVTVSHLTQLSFLPAFASYSSPMTEKRRVPPVPQRDNNDSTLFKMADRRVCLPSHGQAFPIKSDRIALDRVRLAFPARLLVEKLSRDRSSLVLRARSVR